MTSRDFCYWLQGFFEIGEIGSPDSRGSVLLSPSQIETVKRHLAMVFVHEIDKTHGDAKEQAALTAIHDATQPTTAHDPKKIMRC